MTRPHVPVVLAVLASAGVPASAVASTRYRHCAGGFDVDASRNEFGFYRGIRERNTNCVQPRAVVHGYVAQLHGVAGSLDGKRVRVGGYVCTTAVTGRADNVTCSASRGRRVKFFGAP
jgi:hypothetical protein